MRAEFGGLNGCGDGVESRLLRGVKSMHWTVQRGELREVEVGGTVFNLHQLTLNQRRQGRDRHVEPAQLGDWQLTSGARQLGEDSLLVAVELGQARLFNQHRVTDGSASISWRSRGLAV